jgi:putative ABC transport system ATP-binding protein
VLTIDGVTKAYASAEGPVAVLNGVSLALAAGESLALTGESGSGKSTLLHLAGALDRPDGGTVSVGGVDLAGLDDAGLAMVRRDRIGIIFQQFNLIPSLSVAANIGFQARLAGRFDAGWTAHMAGVLGLTALLGRYPDELSGGQQQRVAIGRALGSRPGLILADEPTGNLDEATGEAVLGLMLDLVAESGAALLMVTHSDRLAGRLARRLHLRAGRVA